MQLAPVPVDRRGRRDRVVPLVLSLVAAGVLVGNRATIGAGVRALGSTDPVGLIPVVALTAATYLFAAVALLAASGRALPVGRTTLVALSAVCANRVTPAGLGAMATNVRYLEADGADRGEAVAAVATSGVVAAAVHTGATLAGLAVLGAPAAGVPTGAVLGRWPLLLAVGLGLVVGAVLLRGRIDGALRSIRSGWSGVARLRRDPRRLALLAGAHAGATVARSLAFAAAAHACGVDLPVPTLVGAFLAGSAAAAVIPSPGGLGSAEATLASALVGLGTAAPVALAAALTYRLVSHWLPVVPGAAAVWTLRRHGAGQPQPQPAALGPAPAPLAVASPFRLAPATAPAG